VHRKGGFHRVLRVSLDISQARKSRMSGWMGVGVGVRVRVRVRVQLFILTLTHLQDS
jgi:hypothetical protein